MSTEASVPQYECSVCHEVFPLTSEFFRLSKTRNGSFAFRRQCRQCEAIRALERYHQNEERSKAYMRQYSKEVRYPRDKEEIKERSRQWRKANPERLKALTRADYYAKREYYHALSAKWQREHPDQKRVYSQKRAARKRLLPDNFTPDEWPEWSLPGLLRVLEAVRPSSMRPIPSVDFSIFKGLFIDETMISANRDYIVLPHPPVLPEDKDSE